jgi:NADH dehydrogenase
MHAADGSTAQSDRPRVVILGAGFGGLWVARYLATAPINLTVVDRHNYHTFFPLLYEVAAAELTPGEIAYPLRNILRKGPNVRVCLANVERVDLAARSVQTTQRIIAYDYLVIALGSESAFYGVPGAAELAFPLKTVEQALALRNHILECFEHAAYDADPERRRRWLTFTIVGGGPTGVEYAGALSEPIRGPLAKDHPTLTGQAYIVLLEAGDSLLAGQPSRLRRYEHKRLERMGVAVRLGERVSAVAPSEVRMQDVVALSTAAVVWTAGVRGEPALSAWGLPVGRGGQVDVLPTLQVPGYPEVYIVGDLAHAEGKQGDESDPYPWPWRSR